MGRGGGFAEWDGGDGQVSREMERSGGGLIEVGSHNAHQVGKM